MVDLTSRKTPKNRINEAIEAEKETIEQLEMPPVNIQIPKFAKQVRPNARLPDYNDEKTKRVGSDLPKSVHKALSLYCVEEEKDKGELIKDMLIDLLRKKKLIE